MPADYVYGLRIVDDLTGDYEYSPPFQIRIPDSTYGQASSSSAALPSTTQTLTSTTSTAPTSLPRALTSDNASPSASATSEPPSTTNPDLLNDTTRLDAILGALAGGIAFVAIILIVVIIYRRVQRDNEALARLPPKQRRSLDGPDSPISGGTRFSARHRRILTSSSFGDGARASAIIDKPTLAVPGGRIMSRIEDESPPPTPFAAPPLNLPRRPSAVPTVAAVVVDRASAQSSQPPSPPAFEGLSPRPATLGRVNATQRVSVPEAPPPGFVLAPAPMARPVPKYSSFNPDTPPTRPTSFIGAADQNHPT
jgi:hypothetical protein